MELQPPIFRCRNRKDPDAEQHDGDHAAGDRRTAQDSFSQSAHYGHSTVPVLPNQIRTPFATDTSVTTASKSDLLDDAKQHVENAKNHVDKAVRGARPYIEMTARIGFAAKGLAYLLIGGFAALAAVGSSNQTFSRAGMLQFLAGKPLGWVLAIGLGIGFGAFGLWQIFWALRDPEFEGHDWKGMRKRFAKFCVGIGHLALVGLAFRVAMGSANTDQSGDAKAQDWTAWAMSYPLGRWIVAGIGIGFVVYTVSQLRKAWKLDPDEELRTHELSSFQRTLSCNIGKFGIAARAVVFFIIGCFLILAAWHAHPHEARGLGGALHALAEQPYGWILLAIVALGLIAYGLYALVQARYRRIRAR